MINRRNDKGSAYSKTVKGCLAGWRFFDSSTIKKYYPLPLYGLEIGSIKIKSGVVLNALFENNPLTTIF